MPTLRRCRLLDILPLVAVGILLAGCGSGGGGGGGGAGPAPSAASVTAVTKRGQDVRITLAGTDPAGRPITYRVIDHPANGSLSGPFAGGAFVRYTPYRHFEGTDTFTYQATAAGVSSAPATGTITVEGFHYGPIEVLDSRDYFVGEAGPYQLYGDASAHSLRLSGDGTIGLFTTSATNLDSAGAGIYARDRIRETNRVGAGTEAVISTDGRVFAIVTSEALEPGDTNGVDDVYVSNAYVVSYARASAPSGGGLANGASSKPELSADGRYVVFTSVATNLVTGDTNGVVDVFRHDRETGSTIRVSVSGSNAQGNGSSNAPSVSADGKLIAFQSMATNLVGSDTNGSLDVFVRSVDAGVTSLVSRNGDGMQGNGHSGQPRIAPAGDDTSYRVVFSSQATNLVPGDTNGRMDVLLFDRAALACSLVSVATGGAQGDQDSEGGWPNEDASVIVFASRATNLVSGDTNGFQDIFRRSLSTGITRRISVNSAGVQNDGDCQAPSITPNGKHIGFEAYGSVLDGNADGVLHVIVIDDPAPAGAG